MVGKFKGTGRAEEYRAAPVPWNRSCLLVTGMDSLVVADRVHAGVINPGSAIPDAPACYSLSSAVRNSLCPPATTCEVAGNRLSFSSSPVLGVMKSMNQRRTGQRIPMELPVEIRWTSRAGNKKQAVGKTGNISGTGLFIEIPLRLHRSTTVSIRVVLPRDATHLPLELLCQGRVVRWNQRGQVQGLGAVIDQYELRPLPRIAPGGKRPPADN